MERSVHSPTPRFRDYEKLYRLLIEDLEDYAIFMMEPDGTIISWNAGVERILGYSKPQFVGRHVSMLFVPEEVRAGAPEMELNRARKDGRAPDERWHLRKDGRRIRVDGMVTAILDGSTLVTSGYTDMVAAERFKGAEVNMFLQKPYTADELAAKIKSVLSA
jgi:PAS domain S-box-containing protein